MFTAVALELATEEGDEELAGQAKPLDRLLTRWEELDRDRRDQQRVMIRSSVKCKRRNRQLDAALTSVHNATLAAVEQDRKAPLFAHLFPKPLSTLIKPALEGQLKSSESFIERLKSSETPATLRKAHDKALRGSLAQGTAAQKQRVATVAASAALATRVDALWEDANAALQHIEGTLKQLAAARRLDKDWIDSFFPDGVSQSKKKSTPPPVVEDRPVPAPAS